MATTNGISNRSNSPGPGSGSIPGPAVVLQDAASMNVLITTGLKKIIDASSRKHKELRETCEKVIAELKVLPPPPPPGKPGSTSSTALLGGGGGGGGGGGFSMIQHSNADRFFYPFMLACDTQVPKLMEIALDCVQKLIAYGYLRGTAVVDPSQYPPRQFNALPGGPGGGTGNTAVSGAAAPGAGGAELTEGKKDGQAGTPGGTAGGGGGGGVGGKKEWKDKDANRPRRLIDAVIETIFSCCTADREDAVQLQVIKCILTAVTSVTCEVHDNSLMLAIRACYHIHLSSRNLVNRTTAKATLTQMLNFIFQNMEGASQQLGLLQAQQLRVRAPANEAPAVVALSIASSSSLSSSSSSSSSGMGGSTAIGGEEGEVKEDVASPTPAALSGPTLSPSAIGPTEPLASHENGHADTNGTAAEANNSSDSSTGITTSVPGADVTSDKEIVALKVVANIVDTAAATIVKSTPTKGKFGWCVVCGNTANHYCLQTSTIDHKVPVCSLECKVINLERQARDSKDANGEKTSDGSSSSAGSGVNPVMSLAERSAMLQNDSLLLFRALCKLSMKPLPERQAEPVALRSKSLSLELLLSVLENSGQTFRTSRPFIDAVKQYLVMSLLKNCVSPVESIFGLSLSIFVTLIRQFKPHLKTEIGVFLDNIFLRIAENANSTYNHKMMILQVFSRICQDPQTIVDIFLNYDCDMNAPNIFQHMITVLEKITQGRFVSDNWISVPQEATLKLLALESLVSTIKSLISWHERSQAAQQASQDAADKALSSTDQLSDANVAPTGEDAPLPLLMNGGPRVEADFDGTSETASGVSGTEVANTDKPVTVSSHLSEQFEKQQARYQLLQKGALRFNTKPKHGLKFLYENHVLSETPESVAEFLHNMNIGLDKTMIGDYLGEMEEFNLKVLYAYVDFIDFRGLTFDEGIRHFLNGFRLPGEAQKIDRMMEKFAEKYCGNNPGAFTSADVAYTLAYSVIMLNTDAHSPMIKIRMTKEQFLKNNRGINGDQDLDATYMGAIYDRIVNNEIKLKDEKGVSEKSDTYINPKKRQLNFLQESQQLVKKTQELMVNLARKENEAGGPSNDESFYYATDQDVEALKPMFSMVCFPALATFSVLLEESDDRRVVQLCLQGFHFAVRISSVFQMNVEREAFMHSLGKFTLLGTKKEMKQKNIDAIKTLLAIAETEANHLCESWEAVLKCISEFERLQLIHSGARADAVFFSSNRTTRATSQENAIHELDAVNSAYVTDQVEAIQIDRIFTQSAKLNNEAIVDFVKHLCAISAQELAGPVPRVFSLQKIVEITYYNMGRIRYVWTRIWDILSKHFLLAGCHSNIDVSMYAIDSLRQLATKFLEKAELANFQFQKQFLKPFETILAQSTSRKNRELIVHCIAGMALGQIKNIKSGWKSVFVVFTTAAGDSDESLVTFTFKHVEKVIREQFALITDQIEDCVNCLVAFACNQYTDISVQAIAYLGRCAQHLGETERKPRVPAGTDVEQNEEEKQADGNAAVTRSSKSDEVARGSSSANGSSEGGQGVSGGAGTAPGVSESGKSSSIGQAELEDPDIKVWFLILTGLSRMISDPRLEVRTRALGLLFKILREHGNGFSPSVWLMIFRGVLFPIFDDFRHSRDQDGLLQPVASGAGTGTGPGGPGGSVLGSDVMAGFAAAGDGRAIVSGPGVVPPAPSPQNGGPFTPSSPSQSHPTVSTPTSASAGSSSQIPADDPPQPSQQPQQILPSQPALPRVPRMSVSARHSGDSEKEILSENSWLKTTCLAALSTLVELFSHFYPRVSFILPELLTLINSCIDQESDDLARIGVKCWSYLLQISGALFDSNNWTIVTQSLYTIFQNTLPHELQSAPLRAALGLEKAEDQSEEDAKASEQNGEAPDSIAPAVAGPGTDGQSEGLTLNASSSTPLPSPSASTALLAASPQASPASSRPKSNRTPSQSPSSTHAKKLNTAIFSPALNKSASLPISSLSKPYGRSVPLRQQAQLRRQPSNPWSASGPPSGSVPGAPRTPQNASRPQPPQGQPPQKPPNGPPFSSSAPPPPPISLPFRLKGIVTKCMVQHLLMEAAMEVVSHFCEKLDESHVVTILNALLESVDFARAFNSDLLLRKRLWQAGFMAERQRTVPELFLQEAHGLQIYVQILQRLYREGQPPPPRYASDAASAALSVSSSDSSAAPSSSISSSSASASAIPSKLQFDSEQFAESRLMEINHRLVQEFIDRDRQQAELEEAAADSDYNAKLYNAAVAAGGGASAFSGLGGTYHPSSGSNPISPNSQQALSVASQQLLQQNEAELRCKGPVVCLVLTGFRASLSDAQLRRHLGEFAPLFTALIEVEHVEIRRALAALFRARIHPILFELGGAGAEYANGSPAIVSGYPNS